MLTQGITSKIGKLALELKNTANNNVNTKARIKMADHTATSCGSKNQTRMFKRKDSVFRLLPLKVA